MTFMLLEAYNTSVKIITGFELNDEMFITDKSNDPVISADLGGMQ